MGMEVREEKYTGQYSDSPLDMDSSSRHAISFHNAVRNLDVQAVGGHVGEDTNDVV